METEKIIEALEIRYKEALNIIEEQKVIAESFRRSIEELKKTLPVKDRDTNKVHYIAEFKIRYTDFNNNWSIADKAIAIIKTENRFINIAEMADILKGIDESTDVTLSKQRFSKALSKVKKSYHDLITFTPNGNNANTFWGLKTWLGEDGEPNEKYEPNKNYYRKRPLF